MRATIFAFGGLSILACSLGVACTVGQGVEVGGNRPLQSDTSNTDPASTDPPGGGDPATGDCLPADVKTLMAQSCVSSQCHWGPGDARKPPLSSFVDMTAPSSADPSQSVAERSLSRMKNAKDPMPPDALLPAAQVSVLEKWVNGGQKPVACAPGEKPDAGPVPGGDGGTTGPDEFAVAPTCTGGAGSTSHNSSMDPGRACNSCHSFGHRRALLSLAQERDAAKARLRAAPHRGDGRGDRRIRRVVQRRAPAPGAGWSDAERDARGRRRSE
jgi:hypothetical protein